MGETVEEHLKRAGELRKKGKFKEALELYTKAVELDALSWEALENRGLTYMDIGNYQAAIEDFDQALKIQPESPAALFSKGECFMYLGEMDKAEKVFSQCVERWPAETLFQKFLAETRRKLRDL